VVSVSVGAWKLDPEDSTQITRLKTDGLVLGIQPLDLRCQIRLERIPMTGEA
jgi:hypothetical protein